MNALAAASQKQILTAFLTETRFHYDTFSGPGYSMETFLVDPNRRRTLGDWLYAREEEVGNLLTAWRSRNDRRRPRVQPPSEELVLSYLGRERAIQFHVHAVEVRDEA